MYQVIYSSVVIWCAILTFFIMNRTLTKLQWIAIFGTSAGLAISSLGNFSSSEEAVTTEEAGKV
jgi:drug/metabolite transporter (DMT)-like permease